MATFTIKKATKSQAKLRMAVFGPSGAGKTMSALRIAHGLGEKVGVIDTERGSASKYSDRWAFDVIDLDEASIDNYVGAMRAFAEAGHDVLIVDSMSHAWDWLLDFVEKLGRSKYKGNKWSAWSEATPKQQALIDAILSYPGHVIATMRSKTEWVTETNERGKSQPRRVGTAPRQRDQVEYEFDLLLELDPEGNTGRFIKDRTGAFQDRIVTKPDEDLGRELAAWLSEGEPAPAPKPTTAPAEAAEPASARPSRPAAKEAAAPAKDDKPKSSSDRPLTPDEADRLANALKKAGTKGREQIKLASTVTGRTIGALTDLTVEESKRVHAAASGEAAA